MKKIRKPLFMALAVAVTGILGVQYVRLLQPAQAREIKAACNGLRPAPQNPAFRCPTQKNPKQLCAFPTAAKEFSAQDHKGQAVALSQYRGKVVVVNFWASWCGVCASEKPGLEQLQRDFSSDDLAVLALASDHDWGKVRAALPRGTPLRILLDPPPDEDSNLGAIAKAWGLTAVPESFIVDRKGVIRHYMINKRDWDSDVAKTCVRSILDEG